MRTLSVFASRTFFALALVASAALAATAGGADEKKPVQHPSHMHAALHELKEARHEMKEAGHDFGGHKEKALKAVDHAIVQLEEAIKYHKVHDKK
jgi:hypothetical protein